MALTRNDLKAIRSIIKEEVKTENQPVIKKLVNLEGKVGALEEESKSVIKRLDNLAMEQKKQGKNIRSMKLKINKTWRLFSWFTKDADERMVENRQRIKKLEEKIEFIQHN